MEQPFWPPSGQNGKATLTTKWSKRLWHCDSWWAKLQSLFCNLVAQTAKPGLPLQAGSREGAKKRPWQTLLPARRRFLVFPSQRPPLVLFRMFPREAKSTEVFWRAAPARLQPVLLVT